MAKDLPNSDTLVFAVGKNQFSLWVEQNGRDIVVVTTTRINFPGFAFVVTPQFDKSIIGSRDNQWRGGMKRDPVDTAIMTLKNVLYNDIRLPEQISLSSGDGCWSNTIRGSHSWHCVLLAESRDVPDTDSLVKTCTGYQIFGWVELSTHHIVIMSSENCNRRARLPVPNTHSLIIGRADNPRIVFVEKRGTNIVQMSKQGEDTFALLVIPDLKTISTNQKAGR